MGLQPGRQRLGLAVRQQINNRAAFQVEWDRICADWPLRCVLYVENQSYDRTRFEKWLAEMQLRYKLVSKRRFREVRSNADGEYCGLTSIEVYEFIPRPGVIVADRPLPGVPR